MRGSFFTVSRTEAEVSVVCEEACVPQGVQQESGWRILKTTGPLDFSLTGILANVALLNRHLLQNFALDIGHIAQEIDRRRAINP